MTNASPQFAGRGVRLAAALDRPGGHMVVQCLKRDYLINCTVDCGLCRLPPLTITAQEVDGRLAVLDTVLGEE